MEEDDDGPEDDGQDAYAANNMRGDRNDGGSSEVSIISCIHRFLTVDVDSFRSGRKTSN